MRCQSLPSVVTGSNGRIRRLDCKRVSIERDIFIKVVEFHSGLIAQERLSRSAIRKDNVVVLELDMQILKTIRVFRFRLGDTGPVDQIAGRNQQTVDEKAVPIGDVEVTA